MRAEVQTSSLVLLLHCILLKQLDSIQNTSTGTAVQKFYINAEYITVPNAIFNWLSVQLQYFLEFSQVFYGLTAICIANPVRFQFHHSIYANALHELRSQKYLNCEFQSITFILFLALPLFIHPKFAFYEFTVKPTIWRSGQFDIALIEFYIIVEVYFTLHTSCRVETSQSIKHSTVQLVQVVNPAPNLV